jgi:hypothetical protein
LQRLALLNHVRQFVGEEALAAGVVGREFAAVEGDVSANSSEGAGVDGSGGVRRGVVGVDADVAEVAAEARLEEGASGG